MKQVNETLAVPFACGHQIQFFGQIENCWLIEQWRVKAIYQLQLAALDTAISIEDMNIPGYRLHPLKGDRKGSWSITVNGNWRITFEFTDGNAYIVNYEDYH